MSLPDLPALPGAYALHLRLGQPERLAVGRLGHFLFPPGEYVYLGSALGPGGLRARLGRHLSGNGRLHWHIDYLRRSARVIAAGWAVSDASGQLHLECCWSQALAALPGAFISAPGFGAADCRLGCAAHLVAFPLGAFSLAESFSKIVSEPVQVLVLS